MRIPIGYFVPLGEVGLLDSRKYRITLTLAGRPKHGGVNLLRVISEAISLESYF